MSGGAAILPDDGAMNRTPGAAVPQKRGLALIGDADGGNVLGAGAGLAHGASAGFERRRPQIFGLVLDLAVGRKMLRKFLLGDDAIDVSARNSMARVEVVPWSIART